MCGRLTTKSYLGMMVHWINEISLKRQKATIACIHIVGRHTYDILAAKIEEVHRSFGLQGKISATVTDNGSNFIIAFTTFSVPDTALDDDTEEHSITDDDMLLDDDVTFTDLNDAITPYPNENDDLTQIKYQLPPHQRCASHMLNLVVSTDVDKHLLSCSLSKSVYHSSFGKCTALWNKTSRSTLALDKVTETLKRKLLVPSPTRWNSYHDAVARVVENLSEILNELTYGFHSNIWWYNCKYHISIALFAKILLLKGWPSHIYIWLYSESSSRHLQIN